MSWSADQSVCKDGQLCAQAGLVGHTSYRERLCAKLPCTCRQTLM